MNLINFHSGTNSRRVWRAAATVFLVGWSIGCLAVERGVDVVGQFNGDRELVATTLDTETIDRLELSIGTSSQAEPGDQMSLGIGVTECCYVFEPLTANVAWSVFPQDEVKIDPETGVIKFDSSIESGKVFTVTANVENDRKLLQGRITIFRPEDNPLVGTWHESEVLPCESGEAPDDGEPLRELIFKADGTFKATFTPFEIYHDYWGTYTYDLIEKKLALQVTKGNFVPEELDLEGGFLFLEDGSLKLSEMWLGRKETTQPHGCGHVFVH